MIRAVPATLGGFDIVLDHFLPLEIAERSSDGQRTGRMVPLACVRMGSRLLVHPDRYDELVETMTADRTAP